MHDFGLSMISPGFIDLDADIDSDHALQDIVHVHDEKKRFHINIHADYSDSYSDEDFKARHHFSMIHLLKSGITTAMPISCLLYTSDCVEFPLKPIISCKES